MSDLLLALDGAGGRLGALGVFDPARGLRYLQVERASGPVRAARIRGVAVHGNRVYAVTQASLRIYRIERGMDAPRFALEREVVRNDWVIGDRGQAGLHSIGVDAGRGRLYLGNHRLDSLEELDLDGEFVGRRAVWELLPAQFPLPRRIGREFDFGRIRGISTGGDRLLVTVFGCNGSRRGVVLDADAGRLAADGLVLPIGGVLAGDRLYVLNGRGRELRCLARNGAGGAAEFAALRWNACPDLNAWGMPPASQGLRGLATDGDTIWCGVGNFRSPRHKDTATGIAAFAADDGALRGVMLLPDTARFRFPKVAAMALLPDGLVAGDGEAPEMWVSGRRVVAQPPPVALAAAPEPAAPARNVTVQVQDAGVCYTRHSATWLGAIGGRRGGREFWALRGVSFELGEGEVLGIIGSNGSGKSSLCMLLAGTLRPDEGNVTTHGRVQLLAIGAGFQSQLSGRENVYISGTLLGLTRAQVAARIDGIIEFSELADFIDEPVRTYSAGMRSRLAFAAATAIQPEILLLDEAMTAGDQAFSVKAAERLEAMSAAARTIIIVSHNLGQLKKACTRVLWLERGRLLMDGGPAAVIAAYRAFSTDRTRWLADHPQAAALLAAVEEAA